MLKPHMAALLLAAAGLAQAQTPAPSSPAKKELTAKVLQLLQPAVEGLARQLAEQPAVQIQQRAGMALQQMPEDKRQTVGKEIDGDLKKYVDETNPIVRDRALKLAPATLGPLLEERFTEDELKQVVALLESPVNRKFQQLFPDMQRALGEKLVAESTTEVEAKVRILAQSVSKRLGVPAPASAPAAPAAKPAAPAKK